MIFLSLISNSIFARLTAAVLFSTLLAMTTPATATETRDESAAVTSKPLALGKKPSARVIRTVIRYPRSLNYCDPWQGRQFVLMLGIGY